MNGFRLNSASERLLDGHPQTVGKLTRNVPNVIDLSTSPPHTSLCKGCTAGFRTVRPKHLRKLGDAKKSPKIVISAPSHNFVGPYLRN